MKLIEAFNIIKKYEGSNINQLLEQENIYNKGNFGHAIEKLLSLKLGSHHLDFEDGELKTATISESKVLKEDFKIAKKWDKTYIEDKLSNNLVVVRDSNNTIVRVCILNILKHPIYKKYFDIEFDRIINNMDTISQKDTVIWVAKTNDTGNKVKNDRALYLSRAFASHILGFGFGRAIKGKIIQKEVIEYEQANSRG